MQSPWLLAYLASREREENLTKAARRREQVRRARLARRGGRRRGGAGQP
jgi:hypothetical protein